MLAGPSVRSLVRSISFLAFSSTSGSVGKSPRGATVAFVLYRLACSCGGAFVLVINVIDEVLTSSEKRFVVFFFLVLFDIGRLIVTFGRAVPQRRWPTPQRSVGGKGAV